MIEGRIPCWLDEHTYVPPDELARALRDYARRGGVVTLNFDPGKPVGRKREDVTISSDGDAVLVAVDLETRVATAHERIAGVSFVLPEQP